MLLERIFIKRHTIESRLLEDWKIYCLQASRCIFQPGNFTGCGSEGVNVGSDESHFNVSLTVMDKVTRQCPQTTTFEEKGEPKQIRTEVPLITSLTPYR